MSKGNTAPAHAPSQKARILQYLQQGNTLTFDKCRALFECNTLPRRILDLKEDNHDIRTNMIKLPNGKRIAEYHLHNSTPEQTKLF